MHALNNSIVKDTQHIVLIDDDDSVRQSLELMLINLGYRVHSYGNAVDFLDTTNNLTPCVILCDMNLPRMSGVEVQTALANKGCTTPIIFISGESSVDQVITAMKQGAVDFLLKPFTAQAMMDVIQRAMRMSEIAVVEADKNLQVSER
mgnify:CR=1 FL=1